MSQLENHIGTADSLDINILCCIPCSTSQTLNCGTPVLSHMHLLQAHCLEWEEHLHSVAEKQKSREKEGLTQTDTGLEHETELPGSVNFQECVGIHRYGFIPP